MTAWINTVGRDHVLRGVAGGFTQSDHGTPDRLRRLVRDDWVAFYSPRTDHPDGAPLQAFTALGRIVDDEPFQVQMTEGFHPFRRRMEFLDCTETPIRPSSTASGSSRTRSAGATGFGSGCSGSRMPTSP